MSLLPRTAAFAFVLILLAIAPARADERILDYQIDVAIQPDASLDVTEHITVRANPARHLPRLSHPLP